MKSANIAPMYACAYPGMCDVARKLGYALAIHGSMVTDLDLIAVPWTDEAVPAEELVEALHSFIGAVLLPEMLRRDGCSEEYTADIINRSGGPDPADKPHGRRAWNLYLEHGCNIDLSVLPRAAANPSENP